MKKLLSGLLLGVSLAAHAQNNIPASNEAATAVSQSPYSLKTGREAGLLGAGIAAYGTAYAFNRQLTPLTPDAVGRLNPASLSAFDRAATRHYSPDADRLSDLTLAAGLGLTGVVILSAKTPATAVSRPSNGKRDRSFFSRDLVIVGVMYAETMLLTNGLKSTVKNAVERTRPFAYNAAAPLGEKLERDTQRSFYSGHAANAFATAVFAGEVFRHYHPRSKAKTWVWVGSLGLGTGTAYLRYEAGQHFPGDLLVGAAVGSLAGWGIPRLHRVAGRRGQAVSVTPWSTGQASGVSFRWTVSDRIFVGQ